MKSFEQPRIEEKKPLQNEERVVAAPTAGEEREKIETDFGYATKKEAARMREQKAFHPGKSSGEIYRKVIEERNESARKPPKPPEPKEGGTLPRDQWPTRKELQAANARENFRANQARFKKKLEEEKKSRGIGGFFRKLFGKGQK